MAEKREAGTNRIDDELAEITDQVMKGEPLEELEMADEVREMAMTVNEIRRAFGEDHPSAAMAARIRANLAREWRSSSAKAVEAHGLQGWLESLMERMTASMSTRTVTLAGAAASVILVFWCAFAGLAGTGGGLTGSAGGALGGGFVPYLFVGGIVVLAGVVWWLLKPRD